MTPTPNPSPQGGGEQIVRATNAPTLTHVVTTLAALGKSELPAQLAAWLDALDETGRWALLKLVTGALRIGVSARLAKTAVAALGDKEADEVELVWPGLAPPYEELFAWIEGRADKPVNIDPAPFRPVMLSHAIEEPDFAGLDPAHFAAEWKWDGIRVQAVAGTGDGKRVARLYSRTGEDISGAFPDLTEALTVDAAIDGELLIMRAGPRAVVQRAAAAAQPQNAECEDCSRIFLRICAPTICSRKAMKTCAKSLSPSAAPGWRRSSHGSTPRASTCQHWCPSQHGAISPRRAPIRPPPVQVRMPRRSKA